MMKEYDEHFASIIYNKYHLISQGQHDRRGSRNFSYKHKNQTNTHDIVMKVSFWVFSVLI